MNTVAIPSAVDLAGQSLGRIAVELPGATAVLRRLKLDFCCGGHVTLQVACTAKGLDWVAVRQELAELAQEAPEPQISAPSSELIDHILTRYHEVHRAQLPELIRMARRVEAVHSEHPQVPAGLADFLEGVEAELLDHMAKEENVLFPMFKRGGHPMAMQPIGVMRHEHTQHGEQLERLGQLTNEHTPPDGACNTWRALFAGTARLTDDLMQHIHLENNVLFPRFEGAAA